MCVFHLLPVMSLFPVEDIDYAVYSLRRHISSDAVPLVVDQFNNRIRIDWFSSAISPNQKIGFYKC